MLFIKNKTVDKTLLKISKSINDSLEDIYSQIQSKTLKEDTGKKATEVPLPVTLTDCLYVFDNSHIVAKVSRILSQDLFLGELTFTPENEEDKEIAKEIQENLIDFQEELYFTGIDYFYAPYGVFEVAYDPKISDKFKLSQMPVITTKLIETSFKKETYFLIEQKTDNDTNYFKIIGEEYPEDFTYGKKELGECVIFGGDNFYKFLKKPEWLQAKKLLFADIGIDDKYEKKIENGNIADAILHINLEPKIGGNQLVPKVNSKGEALLDGDGNPIMELADDEEDIIDEELEDKEGGIAVVYSRTENPRTFQLVDIEAKNNDTLDLLSEKAEYKVLSSYNVPKIRLGIMDEKQSMNSTRDQSVWEIYTKDLGTFQKPLNKKIEQFIYLTKGVKGKINITTPIFSDTIEIETDRIHKAWNNAGLTLKQYLTALSEYLPIIKLEEYDFTINTGLWNSRYYNGQPFNTELNDSQLEEFNNINNMIGNLK